MQNVLDYAYKYEGLKYEASRRLEAIVFWEKGGISAAKDAYKVSRATQIIKTFILDYSSTIGRILKELKMKGKIIDTPKTR